MRSWLELRTADLAGERPAGADEDVHFVESLAATVIEEYTRPGDVVLDPFAGFGTTLVVAERLGRTAIGVEMRRSRADAARARVAGRVVTGDAREVGALVPGPVDLCFTSPPYMTASLHPENPLTAYQTLDGDYATYLGEIADIFRQVAGLLRPGGHAVVNVANTEVGGIITPLAWDVARAVSAHLTLRHETFLCWDQQPVGISGDYLFVFEKESVGNDEDAVTAR